MFSHAMYFVIITYMSVVVLLLLCLLFAFILMLKINVTLYKLYITFLQRWQNIYLQLLYRVKTCWQ